MTAALAPRPFESWLPAVSSPVSFGALVAFLVNLLTLPLVRRSTLLTVPLDMHADRLVTDWFAGLGGAWGLKPQTGRAGHAALVEFVQILLERGVNEMRLAAVRGEDRVEIRMTWAGPPLPAPTHRPSVDDLLGDREARELSPSGWPPSAPNGSPSARSPAKPGPAKPGPAEPGPAEPGPAKPGPAKPGPAEPRPGEPKPA